MNPTPLRILVADDSASFRAVMVHVLRSFPEAAEVHVARDGLDAVQQAQEFRPHLVFLDLDMPKLGGLEALARLRGLPDPPAVVVVSGMSDGAARLTLEAVQAGALDFVCKPTGPGASAGDAYLVARLAPFVQIVAARQRQGAPAPGAGRALPAAGAPPRQDLVVLGASTGAPGALAHVVAGLPAKLPVPVLIAVHIPEVFSKHLARQLGAKTELPVDELAHGMALAPGRIFIAPGGQQLTVAGSWPNLRAQVAPSPESEPCRPCIDRLLSSIADRMHAGCLAAIMTGMGRDGTAGVRALKRSPGHYCVVQSSESCVVSGMPDSVLEGGLADEVVPLDGLAARIVALTRR